MDPQDMTFVEGFTKAAVAAGATPEQVPVLLELAATMELLEKDAAFCEGFESVMEKSAVPVLLPVLAGLAGAGIGVLGTRAAGNVLDRVGGPGRVHNRMQRGYNDWTKQLTQMGIPDNMLPKLQWPGQQQGFPRPGYGYSYGIPAQWRNYGGQAGGY